jgi:hypothetical protein
MKSASEYDSRSFGWRREMRQELVREVGKNGVPGRGGYVVECGKLWGGIVAPRDLENIDEIP